MMSRYKLSSDTRTPRLFTLYMKEAEKYLTEAATTDDMTNVHGKTATWKAQTAEAPNTRKTSRRWCRDKWREKAMHGKFPNYMDKDHVDVGLSFKWMKHTGLKGETEGLITTAQDQGTEHQILQQTHHQARNHRQMQNVPYTARNCGTPHIRVPNTSSRSVP